MKPRQQMLKDRLGVMIGLSRCLFALSLIPRRLEADAREESHYVLGHIGEKHRYPMKLINMIRGMHSVLRAKGADHLRRQLHIHYVDNLIAGSSEFPPRHLHRDRVPFSVIRVSEHRGFKILVKGMIGRKVNRADLI